VTTVNRHMSPSHSQMHRQHRQPPRLASASASAHPILAQLLMHPDLARLPAARPIRVVQSSRRSGLRGTVNGAPGLEPTWGARAALLVSRLWCALPVV
jgi:hypothetical protein